MDLSRDRRLFDELDRDRDGRIWAWELLGPLGRAGILPGDPRIRSALGGLQVDHQPVQLDFAQFTAIAHSGDGLVLRALEGSLAVADFPALTADIARMHDEVLQVTGGRVADYIPRLAEVDPDQLAIAVCTVDGQQFSVGNADVPFCVQSVTKPFMYALALEEHGAEAVHRRVGQEQSGGAFNELVLNPAGLPHNPMINAGAMASASLIRPELPLADRYDHVARTWARMTAARPGFDNATYLSEQATGYRNYALADEMRNKGVLPASTDPRQVAEFYFQNCSIEVDASMLAAAAGTLAGGGRSPFADDRVFAPDTVRNTLSMMSTSGMYDYSGEFFREIGRPAKSGVSGAVILVVPDVMGVCVWSPRLDDRGNSVRGIEFCRRLAAEYKLHVFDSDSAKRDLRGTAREVGASARDESAVADVARRALGGLPEPAAVRADSSRAPWRPRQQTGGQAPEYDWPR